MRECLPIPVLEWPVVLALRALAPIPVLLQPVVIEARAPTPSAVLLLIPAAPRPTVNPLTSISLVMVAAVPVRLVISPLVIVPTPETLTLVAFKSRIVETPEVATRLAVSLDLFGISRRLYWYLSH